MAHQLRLLDNPEAAQPVTQMEDQGVVTPANAVGKREILVPEVQ